jgi:hypothetical protein
MTWRGALNGLIDFGVRGGFPAAVLEKQSGGQALTFKRGEELCWLRLGCMGWWRASCDEALAVRQLLARLGMASFGG